MNRIKWGTALVATAAVATGISVTASTLALWQDEETSSTQSVTYGSLDLVLGGEAQTDPIWIENGAPYTPNGWKFSDAGPASKRLKLTNEGTVPGEASFSIRTISSKENSCTEPESHSHDNSCPDYEDDGDVAAKTNNNGELDESLIVVVYDSAWSQQLGSMTLKEWNDTGASKVIGTLDGGESTSVIVEVARNDSDNRTQTDSVKFVLDARLDQVPVA